MAGGSGDQALLGMDEEIVRAKAIIKYYASLVYWCDGLEKAAACWRATEATGIEYTDEEKQKMHQASAYLSSAKKLVNEVYSARIGAAVTQDVRCGEWK